MARQDVRGRDVPLNIGVTDLPPDAATDPGYEDQIADPEKGYHTGLVRQPAEPVQGPDGAVRFETIGDAPSLFDRGGLKELKAAHNDAEAGGIPGETEHVSITPFTDALGEAPRRRAAEAAADTASARAPRGGARVERTPDSEIAGSGTREVSGRTAGKA